jgi:hypothetical protein
MKASTAAKIAFVLLGLPWVLNAPTRIYAVKSARLFSSIGRTLPERGLVVVAQQDAMLKRANYTGSED